MITENSREQRKSGSAERDGEGEMRSLYYNGAVYTGTMPLVEAFVVEDGIFCFAGSNEEARTAAGPDAVMTDLEGRFVCPAFNDSHMHLLEFGQGLYAPQVEAHTSSLGELLNRLRDFEKKYPRREGEWLVARGWNQDDFTDVRRMPDRWDLDKVSQNIPICVVRMCGHCLTVNSKALELLGVTADSVQPEGGRIGMENGAPDGRFYENAVRLVYDVIPQPDREELKKMILAACRVLNSYGITCCQTDDYGAFRGVSWQTINKVYRELEKNGDLTVRIYEQCNFEEPEELREFVESGYRTGIGSDFFRIGPLKIVADGALGARTAYLSRPYADAPYTCGMMSFPQETLEEMISYANEQGMQIAVHAIGDGCLDRVLAAFEKALKEHPRRDHRHGIVHCQITRPDQLEQIRQLKLHVYSQSIFLDYDIRIVEARVGKEMAATSYNWKTLLCGGVSVSNGSDCPIEAPHVMSGIQCAVTRCTLDGTGPYLPEQAYTVQEALESYTVRGAEACFGEERMGQIRAGMLADFAVLGANPFETEPGRLKEIPVCATYLGGRKVFG